MKRLLKDESGMTLALAIIMIVLIGVMGAGLLTFVSRDLNTVVEVNQGQRAFEIADAGINAAKRQLISTPDPKFYDNLAVPIADSSWADSSGGEDLTMDDDGVNVRIQSNTPSAGLYTVTSTGCSPADCSDARRKVEAIYRHTNSIQHVSQ
jgi:hypothetical protein